MDMKNNEDYIKALYSKAIKVLYNYVLEVLEEYQYEGSPINNGFIDRETLNQIIDNVLLKASELEEIDEINIKDNLKGVFNEKAMLRGLIELMVINELFVNNNIKDTESNVDESREELGEGISFYINLFEEEDEENYEEEVEIEVERTLVKAKIQYFGDFL